MRILAKTHRQSRKEEAKERGKTASMLIIVFAVSTGLVLIGGALLGLLTLVEYLKEPEAVFEAVPKREIKIPPKTPEHSMNVAKHEASKPKPTFSQKLISTKPSEFALPDIPQVDLDQMLPLDPSELVSDQVSSLVGTSGMGNGLGNSLAGGGGLGSGTSFLGIKANGSRVLLIFDISTSVVNKAQAAGIPFSSIKTETIKLVEGLNPNMRFGMIQFSRAFRPFPAEELMVATSGNKKSAIEWINKNWKEGSLARNLPGVITRENDGILEVLKQAFSMDPEIIFLISDGSFQDKTNRTVPHDEIGDLLKELQRDATTIGGVQFNFIGFGMDEDDQSSMKKIVRRQRGNFKELK